MKINIKDVLKNDTEKADLHSEHWLTDAIEERKKNQLPRKAIRQKMPDTDSEEEIPPEGGGGWQKN